MSRLPVPALQVETTKDGNWSSLEKSYFSVFIPTVKWTTGGREPSKEQNTILKIIHPNAQLTYFSWKHNIQIDYWFIWLILSAREINLPALIFAPK